MISKFLDLYPYYFATVKEIYSYFRQNLTSALGYRLITLVVVDLITSIIA